MPTHAKRAFLGGRLSEIPLLSPCSEPIRLNSNAVIDAIDGRDLRVPFASYPLGVTGTSRQPRDRRLLPLRRILEMRSNGKLLAADKVRKTPEGIKMRRRGTIFNPTSLQYNKQKQALHPPKVWMISAYSKTSSPPRHHCCPSWFNGSWDRLRFNPVTTV
jgi:hypothetical protein